MNNATKRNILRWFHLILAIPILGYIYSPFEQLPQYAPMTRFVFVPVMVLSGFWMYAGATFAVIGVTLWLGAYKLFGMQAAVVGQIGLFIVRKVWLVVREKMAK